MPLTTLSAINITYDSAQLRGDIGDLSGTGIAYIRFVWRDMVTDVVTYEPFQSASSDTTAIRNISGLESDRQHRYEIYGYDSDYDYTGDAGGLVYFTTDEKDPAEVSTLAAGNITHNSAQLRGSLDDMGDYDEVRVNFSYRKSGGSWTNTTTQTKSSTGSFYRDLTGLDLDSTYEFYARVMDMDYNLLDTGSTLDFTTDDKDPAQVTTSTAMSVTENSAQLNGEVTDMGDYSNVYANFAYRKAGTSGSWTLTTYVSRSSPGTYNRSVSYLESDTTYDFYARVTDTDYNLLDTGSTLQFKTDEQPATVSSVSAINITHSAARIRGSLDSMGDYTQVRVNFSYRKSGGSWFSTPTSTFSDTVSFFYDLTGLDSDSTYQFYARVMDMDYNLLDTGSTLQFDTEAHVYPIKYWTGNQWQEVSRDKLKFRIGSSWLGNQNIKAYIAGSWEDV